MRLSGAQSHVLCTAHCLIHPVLAGVRPEGPRSTSQRNPHAVQPEPLPWADPLARWTYPHARWANPDARWTDTLACWAQSIH